MTPILFHAKTDLEGHNNALVNLSNVLSLIDREGVEAPHTEVRCVDGEVYFISPYTKLEITKRLRKDSNIIY